MDSLSFAVTLLAAMLSGTPAATGGESISLRDAVVAVVNHEVITRSDVLERATPALEALDPALPREEQERRTREILAASLRALVDEKLLTAEGLRLLNGNEPFRARLEERIRQRIEDERRRAGGETQFREALARKGISYTKYVEQLRSETLRDVVLYQFVLRDLSVGPDEALNYYRANLKQFEEPARVKYRQIALSLKNYDSREKALETARYLLELLRRQHDFAALAQKYSDCPRAKEGGLYDFQARGSRPKPIDDALFSLPVGEPGGPVEAQETIYIFKVEERSPDRIRPFEEVQPDIEARLIAQKRIDRYAALIRRLEEENYVEIVP